MVCTNPSEGPVKYYFYTLDWEYKDYLIHHYPDPCFKKPDCLDELLRLASKVSEGFKFARVDTFIFENKPIFGEITFTPSGFLDNTTTREFNIELGKLIDIEI